MIKRKIKETVEEYDQDGKVIRKMTTETEETDNTPVVHTYTTSPWTAPVWGVPACGDYLASSPHGGMGGSAPLEKESVE